MNSPKDHQRSHTRCSLFCQTHDRLVHRDPAMLYTLFTAHLFASSEFPWGARTASHVVLWDGGLQPKAQRDRSSSSDYFNVLVKINGADRVLAQEPACAWVVVSGAVVTKSDYSDEFGFGGMVE